jgi:List-Bact-rpt repeat protein
MTAPLRVSVALVLAGVALLAWHGGTAGAAGTSTLRVQLVLASGATAPGAGTVLAGPPITERCRSTCAYAVAIGETVTLAVDPAQGYEFDHWGDASLCPRDEAPTCQFTASDTDITLLAFLRPATRTLQVEPSSIGRITSGGNGIDCVRLDDGTLAGTCAADYTAGAKVTLSVLPAAGERLVRWSVWECPGRRRRCTIVMNADRSVVAAMDPVRLTVTRLGVGGHVTSTPRGIDCFSACTTQTSAFRRGSTVTLNAVAEDGPPLHRWGDPCAGPLATCSIQLLGDERISVAFGSLAPPAPGFPVAGPAPSGRTAGGSVAAGGYSIQVSIAARGVVTLTPPGARGRLIRCRPQECDARGYGKRESVQVRAVPAPGWALNHWSNGCEGRTRSCFLPVITHSSIRARFQRR